MLQFERPTRLFLRTAAGIALGLLLFAACDPDPGPAHTRTEIKNFVLEQRIDESGFSFLAEVGIVLTRDLGEGCWEVRARWGRAPADNAAVYVDERGPAGPYVVAVLAPDEMPLTRERLAERRAAWQAPTPTPTPPPTPTATPTTKTEGSRFVNGAYGYTITSGSGWTRSPFGWDALVYLDAKRVSFRRTNTAELVDVWVIPGHEDIESYAVELARSALAVRQAAPSPVGAFLSMQDYGFGDGSRGKELVFERRRVLLAAQAGLMYVLSYEYPNETSAERELAHSFAFIPSWSQPPTPTPALRPTPTGRPRPTPTPRPESLRCLDLAT